MRDLIRHQALLSLLAISVLARDVPANIKSLYNSIRASGQCNNILQGGFYSEEQDSRDFSYCGDHLASDGIIYLQGTGGDLANMDISCHGSFMQHADGSCDTSHDTNYPTRFYNIVESYGKGVWDLNPYVHSFVIFGNYGNKKDFVTFDPQSIGIEPYSLMAIVCGDQLLYGIWGDGNEDDGPSQVGEASSGLGRHCYGTAVDGNNAHTDNDVLYIAFTGRDAVPGADGAKWDATTFDEFEQSLQALGDRLIAKIGGGSASVD